MSEILNNLVTSIHGDPMVDFPKVDVPIKDYDTMTIKHLSYSGTTADAVFILWCTYTNSYVTSFITDASFNYDNSLDTIILLNKSNFEMSFKLFFYDPAYKEFKPCPDSGVLSITLEFNKYKK